MPPPLATVGIASIGEMGLGIARLLSANDYRVLTNVSGRSLSTRQRAESASIELVDADQELVAQADYILSIVPPRDAVSTAKRFTQAAAGHVRNKDQKPLFYIDLNAISPSRARTLESLFKDCPMMRFLDGGIIGGAPKVQPDGSWTKPSLVVSGPDSLDDAPINGAHLAKALNLKHISDTIGPASGLKMCFASTTKGLTAIAIQSFTTANKLGVLDDLQTHLKDYSPKTGDLAAKGLVNMPPKAYRWVDEMKEIAETFHTEGGFEKDMFDGVSEVYRFVADETDLGNERTEERRVGKTPEDVAGLMGQGLERKKEKTE
ncbi:MAG: hypothetical protein ALECFALPRED_003047 [Alectoria fallacina]|uniref:6-phosphogluconate dehydrogenase C-terminal domain-like protein n=1 Tax=Alectoria fallacina TaxID=1903189 RepID=A0A8H3EKP7_9LECA|nr:MAG: hypothetical protein ALECFALPRED_003047 [Alectoria fallacina]